MKTFTCPRHDLQLNTFPRLSRILWYQITTRSRLSLVFRWCKWSGILKQRANYCTWALGFKRLEQPKDGFISRYLLFIQSILQRLLLPMGRKVFILPGNLAEELRHLEPRIWLLRWAYDEWFHIEQPQEKVDLSKILANNFGSYMYILYISFYIVLSSLIFFQKNSLFLATLEPSNLGASLSQLGQVWDGWTDERTLLQRCEDASKNKLAELPPQCVSFHVISSNILPL